MATRHFPDQSGIQVEHPTPLAASAGGTREAVDFASLFVTGTITVQGFCTSLPVAATVVGKVVCTKMMLPGHLQN